MSHTRLNSLDFGAPDYVASIVGVVRPANKYNTLLLFIKCDISDNRPIASILCGKAMKIAVPCG